MLSLASFDVTPGLYPDLEGARTPRQAGFIRNKGLGVGAFSWSQLARQNARVCGKKRHFPASWQCAAFPVLADHEALAQSRTNC
jgi:hypothetical protein